MTKQSNSNLNLSRMLAVIFFLAVSLSTSFAQKNVLVFIVDGLQRDAAEVAAKNGAENFKFFIENGVTVNEAYCTSPAPYLRLPDGSLPWSTASSPNVSIHTGTHIFESRQMDDIFLSARKNNIKSLFAGGADNYKEFNTTDFCYHSSELPDSIWANHAIEHFKNDGVRLIRLHMQRIRNNWTGPIDKSLPGSKYQTYLLHIDYLLGKLINTFKEAGVWDSTYVIISSDHGMGITNRSDHPPSVAPSWSIFMNFYGPGIKKGAAIPYAETPDIAIMVNHILQSPKLQGHTDPSVGVKPKGTTGTLLTNIFEGNPDEIEHPKFIRRYLESNKWTPGDEYGHYRLGMIEYMKELIKK